MCSAGRQCLQHAHSYPLGHSALRRGAEALLPEPRVPALARTRVSRRAGETEALRSWQEIPGQKCSFR